MKITNSKLKLITYTFLGLFIGIISSSSFTFAEPKVSDKTIEKYIERYTRVLKEKYIDQQDSFKTKAIISFKISKKLKELYEEKEKTYIKTIYQGIALNFSDYIIKNLQNSYDKHGNYKKIETFMKKILEEYSIPFYVYTSDIYSPNIANFILQYKIKSNINDISNKQPYVSEFLKDTYKGNLSMKWSSDKRSRILEKKPDLLQSTISINIGLKEITLKPLTIAIYNGNFRTVKFLLDNGADFEHTDNLFENPLTMNLLGAIYNGNNGHFKITKLLKKHGIGLYQVKSDFSYLESKSFYFENDKSFLNYLSRNFSHNNEIEKIIKYLKQ